MSIGDKE